MWVLHQTKSEECMLSSFDVTMWLTDIVKYRIVWNLAYLYLSFIALIKILSFF